MRAESLLDQIFFCTVRIATESPDGGAIGTGFLYNITQDGEPYPFIVTNRHVIEGALRGSFWLHSGSRENIDLASPIQVPLDQLGARSFCNPDPEVDIAAIPLADTWREIEHRGEKPFGIFLDETIIPDSRGLEELDSVEEIVFVGYPRGIYDHVNHLPIVRRGYTATPVQIDYCGQRTFLIDASVFPGSSGSPVFIIRMMRQDRRGNVIIGSPQVLFLGVVTEAYTRGEFGRIVREPAPTISTPIVVSQMINLGIVTKSEAVEETCLLCLERM